MNQHIDIIFGARIPFEHLPDGLVDSILENTFDLQYLDATVDTENENLFIGNKVFSWDEYEPLSDYKFIKHMHVHEYEEMRKSIRNVLGNEFNGIISTYIIGRII